MKITTLLLTLFSLLLSTSAFAGPLKVVTTLPDYCEITKRIGGDRVEVEHLVNGDQDAHFIRPKPSFIVTVTDADILIATGLDMEQWLPTIVDKSGNENVRSEKSGFVAASDGMRLVEVPEAVSRSEGGVHLYGNPHVTASPINMRVAARNITAGLIANDPDGEDLFMANLKAFEDELDARLYGQELVDILGGKTLNKMAEKGKLIEFLEEEEFDGKPLIDSLGGWMKKMMPLRDKTIVTYHKNWVYFTDLFGIHVAVNIEPKPGIPPSAKHVSSVIEMMKDKDLRIVLAANYYDQEQVKDVADKTDAAPVIVPNYVGGADGVDDYFALVDHWTDALLAAAKDKGVI